MIRMGISPHDCFERADLKKKLVENVPELRREMERRESLASQSSSEGIFAMGSSRNSSVSGTTTTLLSKAYVVRSSALTHSLVPRLVGANTHTHTHTHTHRADTIPKQSHSDTSVQTKDLHIHTPSNTYPPSPTHTLTPPTQTQI